MSRERSQGADRSGLRHILEVRCGEGGGTGGGRERERERRMEEEGERRKGGERERERSIQHKFTSLQKRLCTCDCVSVSRTCIV